jgi:hypothetical protein
METLWDGVWTDNWIYWTQLNYTTRDYTLQFTVRHTHTNLLSPGVCSLVTSQLRHNSSGPRTSCRPNSLSPNSELTDSRQFRSLSRGRLFTRWHVFTGRRTKTVTLEGPFIFARSPSSNSVGSSAYMFRTYVHIFGRLILDLGVNIFIMVLTVIFKLLIFLNMYFHLIPCYLWSIVGEDNGIIELSYYQNLDRFFLPGSVKWWRGFLY